MKRFIALLSVAVMIICMALGGCSKKPTGSGGSEVSEEMTICVGSYPDTIDPALNSTADGATYIIHAFSGLVGYMQSNDGTIQLVPDCAVELPEGVEGDDGKVSYTYTLKDNLKWSDGSPVTAEDFVWAWNRAVSPETAADYEYMFSVIDGYEEASVGEGKLNVTASEDKKSLTIVLSSDVPYFNELLAFPAYMPVKRSVVEGNESWAVRADTYIGNGPYKVTEFTGGRLVMEKNENYHNAQAVKTQRLIFSFNEDDSSLYANFQNGSYMFIDSVPNDQIESIAARYPDEYRVAGQLGTYFISFNVNDDTLRDFTEEERVSIRKALSLLLERNYICTDIGKGGQVPANTFVPMGLTTADGASEFMDDANGGKGYFSTEAGDYEANCEEAMRLFEEVSESSGLFSVNGDVLSGFPTLTYITNEGTTHQQIATYMKEVFENYGINLKIEVQEWNTYLNTRKAGDYSVARNGWVADYNDPICFLEMWVSTSGNNDCQFGKGEHKDYKGYSYGTQDNLTWEESYDKLIDEIKSCKDTAKRYELMHKAEDMVMSTGAVCPIYYYTDQYMCSSSIEGFFSSPLGYKYFIYAYSNA